MENVDITSPEFIEKLYGWAFRHARDRRDAEDICHSIFLELLIAERKNITMNYAYVWRLAAHVLSDYYAAKAKLNVRQTALEEEQLNVLSLSAPSFEERIIEDAENSEQLARVMRHIAYLSRIYREVMILFYLDRLPIRVIAERLDVSVNCVKQRLFSARNKIRKEENRMNTTHEALVKPATLYLPGSGQPARSDLRQKLSSALAQNICAACHMHAKSAAEIAQELGVATYYIEDMAERILGEPLKKTEQGSYIANFIIIDGDVQRQIDAKLDVFLTEYAVQISEYLQSARSRIEALPLMGLPQDFNAICWSLMAFLADGYIDSAQNQINTVLHERGIQEEERPFYVVGKAFRDAYTTAAPFYSMNGNEIDGYTLSNIQGGALFQQSNRFYCYPTGSIPPELCMTIACIGGKPDKTMDEKNRAALAAAVEKGYVREQNGLYYPDIVIYQNSADFWSLVHGAMPIFEEYASRITDFYLHVIDQHVPPHLMGQAFHFLELTENGRHTVFETLIQRKILHIPDSDRTTVGIYARPIT